MGFFILIDKYIMTKERIAEKLNNEFKEHITINSLGEVCVDGHNTKLNVSEKYHDTVLELYGDLYPDNDWSYYEIAKASLKGKEESQDITITSTN